MEPKFAALSIVDTFTAADLLVSAITMTLGVFATVSPRRAAELWASERLRNMPAGRQASFVRWYRVLGICLLLCGALLALDGMARS